MADDDVQQAIDAIRAGKPVLLPTDGVYGLCASAYREAPAQKLYALKGREQAQPSAILASSVDMLFECVPELRGRAGVIARALLPGPYTLILKNPARRYPWLTGSRPDTIGVRVAELPRPAQHVLDAVGAVGAASRRRARTTPERIRACGAARPGVVDGDRLTGEPGADSRVLGPPVR